MATGARVATFSYAAITVVLVRRFTVRFMAQSDPSIHCASELDIIGDGTISFRSSNRTGSLSRPSG